MKLKRLFSALLPIIAGVSVLAGCDDKNTAQTNATMPK